MMRAVRGHDQMFAAAAAAAAVTSVCIAAFRI